MEKSRSIHWRQFGTCCLISNLKMLGLGKITEACRALRTPSKSRVKITMVRSCHGLNKASCASIASLPRRTSKLWVTQLRLRQAESVNVVVSTPLKKKSSMDGFGSYASDASRKGNLVDFLRPGGVTLGPFSDGEKCQMSHLSVDFQEQFGSTCRHVYAHCSRREKARSARALVGAHSVTRFLSSIKRSIPSVAAFLPSINFFATV